ncbi:MAG: hypothetical protein F6J95_016110 [Leptolyngbya sp. SIO1E4]|nr:hypothetical protein [Leptolyngbya sp. SIO1E4]
MRLLLTRDTWDKFAFTFVQTPVLHTFYKSRLEWRSLPIARLKVFERVAAQFMRFGVHFEDAIAARPSNPRFLTDERCTVVMPTGQCRSFKVNLAHPIRQMRFWVVGSQAITISALNRQGHCVAMAKTEIEPHEATAVHKRYAEQGMTIKTGTANVVRIDSKAPFVLTRCEVQQFHRVAS